MEFNIIPVPDLTKDLFFYEKWLEKRYHGEMEYLRRTRDKRKSFPEWVKSILVVKGFYNDISWDELNLNGRALISKYAIRTDYHSALKRRIAEILSKLELRYKEMKYQIFVDSAPVLEKPIGRYAGFGILGFNTLLINLESGSYFNLGGAFLSMESTASYSSNNNSPCPSCNLCVESCPTRALVEPGVLDARKCISYLTVEYKGVIPKDFAVKMQNWVFGCDVCQEVCPLNKGKKHNEVHSPLREELLAPYMDFLLNLNEKSFYELFNETPVVRARYVRFVRNLIVVVYNSGELNLLYKWYKRSDLTMHPLWLMQLKELGVIDEH